MRRAAAALCFLFLFLPGFLHGQVGSTTDILTGTITDENGAPLARAIVEAMSLETQITRRTTTDARGRYTILFPDGGGQYQMTARYLGRQPQQTTLQRYADEDRFSWNPQLPPLAITLAPVTVHPPPRAVRAPDVPTPGSTERARSPELVGRLPLEDNDLNLLATLVPGVLGLAATDSTAAAFSVAGLRSDANAVTLDGLNIGTSSLPQEGLRTTRIVTSTYDVSRGSFSGGLVAATTRGGANIVQGSSSYALRDQSLAVANDESSPFTRGYTQTQLSGGIGGPLARDRLFIFASGQVRLRDDAQLSLLDATPTDLERLGVQPDSVTSFLGALQTIGLSPTSVQPVDTRTTDNLTSLLRLDYIAGNSHTITLRADGRWGSQDPSRIQPLSLPQVGGSTSNWGGGLMATVTSRFGVHVINEAKIYPTVNRQDGEPFTALPSGRVLLASDLSGTAAPGVGVGTLVFGGNASLPTGSRSSGLETSDEISFLPGSGSHRLKLGVTAQTTRSTTQPAANRLGTFTYNSLADLESNQPASFSRTLVVAPRAASSHDYAA
jgi:carboxypeptidase family protein